VQHQLRARMSCLICGSLWREGRRAPAGASPRPEAGASAGPRGPLVSVVGVNASDSVHSPPAN